MALVSRMERFSDLATLADGALSEAIKLLVYLLQRTTPIKAEDNDGITSTLGIQRAHASGNQQAIGLATAECHCEGNGQHLVTIWMALFP